MSFTTPITHEVTQGTHALEMWLSALKDYVNGTLQGDTGVQGDTGIQGATGVTGATGA